MGCCRYVPLRHLGDEPPTSLDVSFETRLRRRGDVLMGCCYYVLYRRRETCH